MVHEQPLDLRGDEVWMSKANHKLRHASRWREEREDGLRAITLAMFPSTIGTLLPYAIEQIAPADYSRDGHVNRLPSVISSLKLMHHSRRAR